MDATSETLRVDAVRARSERQCDSNSCTSEDDQSMFCGSEALCFPHRVPVEFRLRAPTSMPPEVARLRDSVSKLSDAQVTALGRLLPSVVCGEESAFHIFWREGQRVSNAQEYRSQALAYRIAADELEHEHLLQQLRRCCPVPL